MRGKDEQQLDVFSYVSPEQRVPDDHPLRPLRTMTDEALQQLKSRFHNLYAKIGRPSIAPEKLLRALLLQVLYSVRSERLLMEQLDYNLLFRWFVGLNMDEPIWDVTVFTKNRERLLDGDIAEAFFQAVLKQARRRNLLSDEHFTVDGTLLEAWASVKSFQRKDGNPVAPPGNATVDLSRERRSNKTHQSTTDPDAKLARNGGAQCRAGDAGTDSGYEAGDCGGRRPTTRRILWQSAET
jgi:transposase